MNDGAKTVLAGMGYDEDGPYLLVNEVNEKTQRKFSVRGRTFSLRRFPERFCTGRFDLETLTNSACPLSVALLPDAKDKACPACQKATGFNPSFYYTDLVSPQQRAYNETPHFVYLAYFAPKFVKAGISSEARGLARLLEQGARAARVVGRFDTAYAARDLEAALCAQPGLFETMRASKKLSLFVEERYDFAEARAVLGATAEAMAAVPAVAEAGIDLANDARDFSCDYFGGPSPARDTLQIPVGDEEVCGGRCIGMIGSIIVFEQGGMNYAVSLKDWESHVIEITDGDVIRSYEFAPQQMSLL